MLRRTGTLWLPVGFHAAWDWGETFFYGVPDSGEVAPGHLFNASLTGSKWLTGGSVGPEASVLCIFLIAVLFVLFAALWPEVRYPQTCPDTGRLRFRRTICSYKPSPRTTYCRLRNTRSHLCFTLLHGHRIIPALIKFTSGWSCARIVLKRDRPSCFEGRVHAAEIPSFEFMEAARSAAPENWRGERR